MHIIKTRAVMDISRKSLKYQIKHKLNVGSALIILLVMMDLDVLEKKKFILFKRSFLW